MAACVGDCFELGPPPDTILSLPPPPLPSFLLPRSAILSVATGNNSQPCFAAFVCEPSLSVFGSAGGSIREQSGIEFIELSHKGIEDTWVFILVTSCVGVLLLGALLAFILIKCRDSISFGSFHPHSDGSLMKPPMPIIGSNLLYPNCSSGSPMMMGRHNNNNNQGGNNHSLNHGMAIDNRMLWATLTPHGTTRHHIVAHEDNNNGSGTVNEDHYEVVDYYRQEHKMNGSNGLITVGGVGGNYLRNVAPLKVKSFENNGFLDLDYADPTPLMHDTSKDDDEDNVDLDSGYQEPQEILSTRIVSNNHNHSPIPAQTHYNPHNGQYTTESRSAGTRRKHRQHQGNTFHGSRPVVSSPTRIENPNVLPPLNLFPNQTQSQSQSPATTMGRYQAQTTATIGGRGKSKYVTTVGAATDRNGTASLNRKINDFSASRNCANI